MAPDSGIIITRTEDEHGGEVVDIRAEEIRLQSKTVTPNDTVQVVTADENYTGLSEVRVNASQGGAILSTDIQLVGVLTGEKTLVGYLGSPNRKLTGTLNRDGRGVYYAGPYDIIPTFEEQILATAEKTMARDVVCEPIPVSRTSNLAGGTTVYIGGTF